MANGDDITVRQMLELVVQKFEQQEKTLGKVESRLDKLEETVLGLRTGDIQQIKLDLNTLMHGAKTNSSKTEITRAFEELKSVQDRTASLEESKPEVAKIPSLSSRLRTVEGLAQRVSELDGMAQSLRILEDRHVELAGAALALSPVAKWILGILTTLMVAGILLALGLK